MAAHRKSQLSDEDYWSASSASKIKSKGINLFDENLDFESTKNFLKKQNPFEEDDDDDTINWDGTSAKVEIHSASARYRPSQPTKGTEPRDQQGAGRPSFSSNTGPTIDDVVGRASPPRKAPTVSDMAKMESEINFLKRSLQATKTNKFVQIPPKDTIKRIIMGQSYSLELYRAKEEKLSLLDEALKVHDGNAIIACVLFLRDTIKPTIFNLEMMRRPGAVGHYVNYLRQYGEVDKLVDLLGMLGRTDEAAMLKYKQAASVKNAETKVRTLQTCYRAHFQTDSWLAHEAGLIQEQVALLERQLPIEADDLREIQKGAPKFRAMPRASSILDLPVITTLYYCCLYHYDLSENNLACPLSLRNAHRLTEKQYVWVALQALAKLKKWAEIQKLFQTKGWLGGTKMKAVIPFDRTVQALHKLKAPRQVLNIYCNLIDNVEYRIDIARKHECHESILETLMQQKDRQGIQQYQAGLKINSQEWFFASDILKNSSIKWKN